MFRRFTPIHRQTQSPGLPFAQPAFAAPLSSQALSERLAVLAEIELPCVIYTAKSKNAEPYHDFIRCMKHRHGQLDIRGDHFALSLHSHDAIWLVNHPDQACGGLAVEAYNRAGNMIARIFGKQDGVNSQVWQDIMDNPLLLVA